MKVQLIAKAGPGMTGTSRYVVMLHNGLQDAGVDVHMTSPTSIVPGLVNGGLRRIGMDLDAFFSSYPVRVRVGQADVYHITTQTMATLMHFNRFPRPVVVTVLDIIPHLLRNDPQLNTLRHPLDRWFYRLALSGLRKADALIAISEYTKQTLIDALGIPCERIHVIHLAVDHDRFRPMNIPEEFRAKHGLDTDTRYILYVGSEDPRKNLKTLVKAFAQVKQELGNVKLLKVGRAHFNDQRAQLLDLIAALGLEQDVQFFEQVSDDELPLFYNVADVFVMPSLYEGFGLPVLEAMACGTPVIAADAASLPEIVGDAGRLFDPNNIEQLASHIADFCQTTTGKSSVTFAFSKQLSLFTKDRSIAKTYAVYQKVVR